MGKITVVRLSDAGSPRGRGVHDKSLPYEGRLRYEHANGEKAWYLNGVLHRDDGPAFEGRHCMSWFRHGRLHRVDGPAVERPEAEFNQWWVNGKQVRRRRPQGHADHLRLFDR